MTIIVSKPAMMSELERPYRAPRGSIGLGVAAAVVWGISAVLGFEQFGLPTVILGLASAYAGAGLYAWRKLEDRRRLRLPGILVSSRGRRHSCRRGDLDAAHAEVNLVPIIVRSRDEVGEMAASFNTPQAANRPSGARPRRCSRGSAGGAPRVDGRERELERTYRGAHETRRRPDRSQGSRRGCQRREGAFSGEDGYFCRQVGRRDFTSSRLQNRA
jgi:hypothetical protein